MSYYRFILPCYIKHNRKNIPINLNWYRNAHYRTSNNIKIKFKNAIANQFDGLEKIEGKIHIEFMYFAKSNNSPDLDNFTSVSKKFFQDACVELGLIDDDSVKYITSTCEHYGGVDKKNPRVEASITLLDQ